MVKEYFHQVSSTFEAAQCILFPILFSQFWLIGANKIGNEISSIQRFIGLVTYLSRFLLDHSNRLEPLRQLVKTNQAWNQTHDEIFEDVKCLVTSSLSLHTTTLKRI